MKDITTRNGLKHKNQTRMNLLANEKDVTKLQTNKCAVTNPNQNIGKAAWPSG